MEWAVNEINIIYRDIVKLWSKLIKRELKIGFFSYPNITSFHSSTL
jgi:hypothetical protein